MSPASPARNHEQSAMNAGDHPLPGTLAGLASAAALAWRAWPVGVVARVAVGAVTVASGGLIQAVALERVVESLAHGRPGSALPWFALLGLSVAGQSALSPLWNHVQSLLWRRVEQAANVAVMQASVSHLGIEQLENPLFADRLEVVRSQRSVMALLFDWMTVALSTVIMVTVTLVLLGRVNVLLVLPVLGVGLVSVAHAQARRRSLARLEGSLPDQRLANALEQVAVRRDGAEDVRLLGLGPWVLRRHRELTKSAARTMIASARRPLEVSAAGGLVEAGLLVVGLLVLLHLARTGQVSPGQVALGVVLLRNAFDTAGQMGSTGADLARNTFVARRFLWLLHYKPAVTQPTEPVACPDRLVEGIQLRHLSFCYPGTSHPVLSDIDLQLPAGSVVALVGENGAGKTTLVKLLLRLYDPTSGQVLVDGTDLSRLDLEGWRSRCTGSFQDFSQFHFLAGESIGVGSAERLTEAGPPLASVTRAAELGGAAAVVATLPEGYNTQLGKELPGGSDLSGGQWQKMAVSRGLMRQRPLLAILDEPTAALDPRAEHQLFERYRQLADDARQWGGVTVLVSHRFSTVQMADLIAVLDDGRLIEVGSHHELLAAGGHYAELYRLQAARYT